MPAFSQLPYEAINVACGDPQTIHARINFQMKCNRPATYATPCGCSFERCQLVAAVNHCSEAMFKERRFFALHKARQNQNRLADAGFTNGNALLGAGDAEPVRACLLQ